MTSDHSPVGHEPPPRGRRVGLPLLAGIASFVLLPLIGWGIDDVRGFVRDPARTAYVFMTLALQLLIVLMLPPVEDSRRAGPVVVRRQRVALVLIQVLSLAIVVVAPYTDRRALAVIGGGEGLRVVGLALYAVGMLVAAWAQASLGRLFSTEVTIQPGHRLVTAGLYRHVRHPRYLGIVVFFTGLSLAFRSWLALAVVALMTLVLVWRMRDEEELLAQAFGVEWEAYAGRSWRLIPFVY